MTAASVIEQMPRRPSVTVRPVPRLEPPTDEEWRAAGVEPPGLGTLLLPFDLPGVARARRAASPRRSLSGPIQLEVEPERDESASDEPEPPPLPSPCRGAVMRLLGVVFEVIGGFRPVNQLRVLCRPDRFGDICGEITGRHPNNAGVRSRAGGFVPRGPLVGGVRAPLIGRSATGAPPRGGRLATVGPTGRIAVRNLQICDVSDEIAEVSIVLAKSAMVWAVAARMELINGRWLCAHLEVV